MSIKAMVNQVVKDKFTAKMGLIWSDIKEIKEEARSLKQKYFNLNKRIRKLEVDN